MEQRVRPLAMGSLSAIQSGVADVNSGTWDAGDLKDGPNLMRYQRLECFVEGFPVH